MFSLICVSKFVHLLFWCSVVYSWIQINRFDDGRWFWTLAVPVYSRWVFRTDENGTSGFSQQTAVFLDFSLTTITLRAIIWTTTQQFFRSPLRPVFVLQLNELSSHSDGGKCNKMFRLVLPLLLWKTIIKKKKNSMHEKAFVWWLQKHGLTWYCV